MPLKRKFNKLIRDPKQFFLDSRFYKKLEPKKTEPLILGSLSSAKGYYQFSLKDKDVQNINLGFSTLFILKESSRKLIHRRLVSNILNDKIFIGFREKSIYFLYDKIKEQVELNNSKVFENFQNIDDLRKNSFQDFRNIVILNPSNNAFVLLRQTNPNIKIICIITDLKENKYITKYSNYIDVLIHDEKFIYKDKMIPRTIAFKSIWNSFEFTINNRKSQLYPYFQIASNKIKDYDQNVIESLKKAFIDTSYKKDANYLLPVLTTSDNLEQIDRYNEDHNIQGLIKYELKESSFSTFSEFSDNIILPELYLRDNLYSLYKDLILNSIQTNNYHQLIKKTLYDGVSYEKI